MRFSYAATWLLVLGTLTACDRSVEGQPTTSAPIAPFTPPGVPEAAPPPASQPIVPPIPVTPDEPADSDEIAVSEDLWRRIEQCRDLAFRSVGPEPFIPFALYDGTAGEELRRYTGEDINMVLATARRDMSVHAQSGYTIAYHGQLNRGDEQSPAVFIEACERQIGTCYRFAQRYRLKTGGSDPETVGAIMYLGECLSAFHP